ncbi:MAG: calycin-like domain-containing protein [Dysgonomonas sp.]
MNKKIINLFLVFSLSLFVFTACSDDDNDLVLEKSEVTVDLGGTTTVKITKGNSGYKVIPADATIATATLDGNVITITGVKAGETTIAVTDNENKSATLKVKVTTLAEQIAATYNGDLSITLPAGEPDVSKKDIVLATSGENIKLTLADFSFGEETVGDIVVDEITLTKTDGVVALVEKIADVKIKLGDVEIPVKVKVSGTVSHKVKKANMVAETEQVLDLTITVTEVPDLGTIAVTFSGAKKAS